MLKLGRAATAVLIRNGQLSLQVKLVVRAPAGRTVRVTRKVLVLRIVVRATSGRQVTTTRSVKLRR